MIGELCCGDSIHYRGDRLTPPYSLSHACRVIGCESEMLSMRPSALLLACLNVELIQLPVCPVGTKSFVTVSDVAVRMQTIVDNQNIHDMYFLYSIVPPILGGRDTDTHRVSSFFHGYEWILLHVRHKSRKYFPILQIFSSKSLHRVSLLKTYAQKLYLSNLLYSICLSLMLYDSLKSIAYQVMCF